MCCEGLEGVTGLTIGLGRSTPGETESSSTRLRILFLFGIGGDELGPGAFGPGWSSLGFSDVVGVAGNGGAGDGGLGPEVPVTLAWVEILSSCPAGCWTVVDPPGPVVVVVVVVVCCFC